MSKIIFYIFAMSHILNDFVNSIKQSLFTYHKGIVPNSFYRKVVSVCDNSRGLYPHFININYLLNVTHSKQFIQNCVYACFRYGSFTKRSNSNYSSLQNFQRLWQQMVCYRHNQKRLYCKIPHVQKAILFRQRQNTSRGYAFTFTKTN